MCVIVCLGLGGVKVCLIAKLRVRKYAREREREREGEGERERERESPNRMHLKVKDKTQAPASMATLVKRENRLANFLITI